MPQTLELDCARLAVGSVAAADNNAGNASSRTAATTSDLERDSVLEFEHVGRSPGKLSARTTRHALSSNLSDCTVRYAFVVPQWTRDGVL